MIKHALVLWYLLMMVTSNSWANTEQNQKIEQAKRLFTAEKFDDAYEVLEGLEDDLAGDLNYDKFFANTALRSGHATNAILALERVVAINPDDVQARSLLAQAYFQSGELQASKSEYQSVLKYDTSKQEAEAINQFITAIDRRMGRSSRFSAYFETGLGWDSNVNSATNDPAAAFSLPVGTVSFEETSGRVSTGFMQLAGGLNFVVPATENVAYTGGLKLSKTLNDKYKEFEIGSIDMNLGVQYQYGKEKLSFTLQNNHFFVDNDAFRESYGAMAQWQHTISPNSQFSFYAQYAKLDFESFDDRDADRYVLGANFAQAFQTAYPSIIFGGIYLAKEDANFKLWDQHIYGVRLGGQVVVTPVLRVFTTAGYEHRDYQDVTPFSGITREDKQYDITLGANYKLAPLWTIKPKISYIDNDSNELLYKFNRSVFTVNVQRDFNW